MTGPLADVINPAKFYLNRVRGFDSVGGQIFGFPKEREVAVNTWLELPFCL